jgi:hypothetical protein
LAERDEGMDGKIMEMREGWMGRDGWMEGG